MQNGIVVSGPRRAPWGNTQHENPHLRLHPESSSVPPEPATKLPEPRFPCLEAGTLKPVSRIAATVGIKGDHLQEASPVPAQKY